ncbi:MAG: OmpA family protein [Marinilabiliaceae bacterium]|nr:OmpA family protein [Marinilabiliaceae bacterium]
MRQQFIKFLKLSILSTFFTFYSMSEMSGNELFFNFPIPIKYPAITPDGSYLVFIAEDGKTATAYESFFKDGKWSEPQTFEYINQLMQKTGYEIGGFNFNHDASMLLFHANMRGHYDIFYSEKKNGQWSEPKNFGAPINSDEDEFSPAISADMKTLFVLRSSPKKRNSPCKELVMFLKDANGKWTGPAYLPEEFNIGCQETPFVAADNVSLYFSSMRSDTKEDGKKTDSKQYNIYHAKKINEHLWFLPSYVDELNSKNNNLSPSMTASGNYFIYNQKYSNLKKPPQSIVNVELPTDRRPNSTMVIEGTITDFFSKNPLEADIIIYDAITSVEKGRYKSTDDGRYHIILPTSTYYKLDFTSEGYSHTYHFKDITTLQNSEKEEFNTTLFNAINLELNIYDSELFYPLTPKVSIYDFGTGKLVVPDLKPISEGKYNCKLNIGNNYRIHVEEETADPVDTYLDLRSHVLYSDFETSIELKATKKIVVINISDSDGNTLLPTAFRIRNLNRNEEVTDFKDEGDGKWSVALRIGDSYEIDITKVGYTYFNTTFNLDDEEEEIFIVSAVLDLMTTDTKMVFNNITFELNSAELNAESYNELRRIIKLMNENLNLRLEISAHTDDTGTHEFNMRLSDRRAKSVADYLILHGIQSKSLKTKGYGKTQPMVPNTTDENRAKNRRVEFKIF